MTKVERMFDRISRRYDLMNSVMTYGGDRRWRRFAVSKLEMVDGGALLDVGAGTGKISFEALRRYPGIRCVGADLSQGMLDVAERRRLRTGRSTEEIRFLRADAQELPFDDGEFNAVVSGYLIRNAPDIPKTLAEQYRVLRSGGRVVCMDTAPPARPGIRKMADVYFKHVIPGIGALLASSRDAYAYLTTSTLEFKRPEEITARLRDAGFEDIAYREFLFGMNIVYWGTKP